MQVKQLGRQAASGVSKIRGVWPAIITDNKDGDGNPGCRVKVKFPWLSEQETTFWARIAVPMAGPGRGTYVLPEIDDQVLVVFEHGDINRPIVIGGLWSREQDLSRSTNLARTTPSSQNRLRCAEAKSWRQSLGTVTLQATSSC